MTENLRGLVRPFVTFLTILALVVILISLVFRFGDAVMTRDVLVAFLTLVASITGFWFGSRTGGQG